LETKEKVFKAAAELFSTQGYYNVSVREICEAANVTKPVLYYYFKDKEDVLAELIKFGNIRFKELLDEYIKPEESFAENLEGLCRVYENYSELYPYLIRIRIHVQLSPLPEKIKKLDSRESRELLSFITGIFAKGKKENFFNKNADLEMILYSLTAPIGVIIAQTVLFKGNQKGLKNDLKKYFQFWKSQFLKSEK
jgi:AcrR family transcriptional regulator